MVDGNSCLQQVPSWHGDTQPTIYPIHMLPWKDGDLLMIYRFTDGKWWKMVENGGKWWKMVEHGGTWWKMVEKSDFHCQFTVGVGT